MNAQDRDILERLIESNEKLIDKNEERIIRVEDHQIVMNKEMGQVHGELKWIKWLLCALLGAVISFGGAVLAAYLLI